MTDNVITVDAWNEKRVQNDAREGTPCEAVTQGALNASDELDAVVVFGLRKDGGLFCASSMPHTADILLMIDRIRFRLMAQFEGDTFS